MSDQALIFHSPDQVSDEELATYRGRIKTQRMLPWLYSVGAAGGFFLVNNYVLRRYLHIPVVVGFGLAGYLVGREITDKNYLVNHATFRHVYDNPSAKNSNTGNPFIVNNQASILHAHDKR